jgi:hypothetical protein
METITLTESNIEKQIQIGVYCNICQTEIYNIDIFLSHVIENHVVLTNDKAYKCIKCEKSYKHINNILKHMMNHNDLLKDSYEINDIQTGGKLQTVYTCSICKRMELCKSYIENHIVTVHYKLNKWVHQFLKM